MRRQVLPSVIRLHPPGKRWANWSTVRDNLWHQCSPWELRSTDAGFVTTATSKCLWITSGLCWPQCYKWNILECSVEHRSNKWISKASHMLQEDFFDLNRQKSLIAELLCYSVDLFIWWLFFCCTQEYFTLTNDGHHLQLAERPTHERPEIRLALSGTSTWIGLGYPDEI